MSVPTYTIRGLIDRRNSAIDQLRKEDPGLRTSKLWNEAEECRRQADEAILENLEDAELAAAEDARERAVGRTITTGSGPSDRDLRDWLSPDTPRKTISLSLAGVEGRANEWYTSGGAGVGATVPTSVLERVIYHINNTSGIFPDAYKLVTGNGENITVPVLATDALALAVSEGTELTNDTTIAFSSETLYARKLAVAFCVSNEMLADSAVDIRRVVGDAAGRAIGTLLATYLATGAGPGSSLPEGLTVGGTSALTAAATDSLTFQEIQELAYSLVPGARKGAIFVGGSGITLALAQMVNDVGDPVWYPSQAAGQPDTLLGHIYREDAAMPAVAAGLKPLAFYNPDYFWVRLVNAGNAGLDLQFSSDYEFTKDVTWARAIMRVDSRVIGSGGECKYITMHA